MKIIAGILLMILTGIAANRDNTGSYVGNSYGNDEKQYCLSASDNTEAAITPMPTVLLVHVCQIKSRLLYNGFFEVRKSSCKVFFSAFSRPKNTPKNYLLKFSSVDISFPFSNFW